MRTRIRNKHYLIQALSKTNTYEFLARKEPLSLHIADKSAT